MSSVQTQTYTGSNAAECCCKCEGKVSMPELVGLHTFRNMKTTKCWEVQKTW